MSLWTWLNTNSGAIQSILALVTIVVLAFTWWAIRIQADAARALTRVAKEQTKAARDAAESTRRQAELLASEWELSTAPLLVAELDSESPVMEVRAYKLFNRGHGMAFKVSYWPGGLELTRPNTARYDYSVQPSTLAPGASANLIIPATWDGWTVQYKDINDQERWTLVFLGDRPQEHVLRRGGKIVYLT